jgi:probable rRNA maturation factor
VIDVADPAGCGDALDLDWLAGALRAAVARVEQPVRRVAVAMLDDRAMSRLHVEHGGEDRTTDVLTFPAAPPGQPIDTDIAVCVDEARRQAARRGHRVERELLLYCLHGVLHCAGYDDHRPDDFDRMHAREDEILRSIGVGDTFIGEPSCHGDGRRLGDRDSRTPR